MPERKATKAEAKYRDVALSKHCEDCTMFRRAASTRKGTCTAVEGTIDPLGTCRFFERKAK
jgi:hypothetical protein